ncbi:hypothetical protein HPP92_005828 [Vanilla planifolia]|uniref:Uncharacterized protein n=1 Tax=Vanilla planifolia TaxID=51239 RepID=A0A835RSV1_VANPL|nr:hypothetical protein HPP92_005828 [Vanilla planifolia]
MPSHSILSHQSKPPLASELQNPMHTTNSASPASTSGFHPLPPGYSILWDDGLTLRESQSQKTPPEHLTEVSSVGGYKYCSSPLVGGEEKPSA